MSYIAFADASAADVFALQTANESLRLCQRSYALRMVALRNELAGAHLESARLAEVLHFEQARTRRAVDAQWAAEARWRRVGWVLGVGSLAPTETRAMVAGAAP